MDHSPTFDSTGVLLIRSRAELPHAERAGAIGLGHLLRANLQGRVALLPIVPSTCARTFKAFASQARRKPSVALIGDDDYAPDAGPARWPIAERAIGWAASVLVHAAGAEIAHYETAVVVAQIVGRVVIIETGTANAQAWTQLAQKAPNKPTITLIVPRSGAHPIMPERGALQ